MNQMAHYYIQTYTPPTLPNRHPPPSPIHPLSLNFAELEWSPIRTVFDQLASQGLRTLASFGAVSTPTQERIEYLNITSPNQHQRLRIGSTFSVRLEGGSGGRGQRKLVYYNKRPMKRGEPSQWGSSPTYISLRSLPEQPRSSRAPSQAEGRVRAVSRMVVVMQRKVHNKQRYHFQLLKQYFLFPDTSLSSLNVTVSPYDPLLFPDQQLHSLLRILETQRIQRKIWAFISLKLHHRSQQLQTLIAPLASAHQRTQHTHKQLSFAAIRQAATQTNHHTATQTHNTHSSHSTQAIQTKQARTLGWSNQVNVAVAGREREERKSMVREERKSVKWEASISRRTAEEEQEYVRRKREESYTICNVCCCSCCCCRAPPSSLARLDADLWQRIQYLRRLEEMAASQSPP